MAIAGLEQRMVRDLNAKGGFGVFDDRMSLLPRSLLWCRAQDNEASLARIPLEDGDAPLPSWSWMAYNSPIDFLDLPFGGVDWIIGEIHGPWDQLQAPGVVPELGAVVRPFLVEPVESGDPHDFETVFDAGENVSMRPWQDWRCIVVGTRRVPKGMAIPIRDRTHYVLVVAPRSSGEGFERIGVGKMAGRLIGPPSTIRATIF